MSEHETDASGDDGLVDELRRSYDDNHARTASLKRTQSALSIALVAVFVGALLMLYSRVTTMYAPEAFTPHITAAGTDLREDIEREARFLISDIQPVYQKAAQARFEVIRPELETMAQQELDGMLPRLQEKAGARVSDSLSRIERRALAQLEGHFPGIEDPQMRGDIKERFVQEMETQTVEVLGRFQDKVMIDIETLSATIERFRPNRFEGQDKNHLTRAWIHHWLMLADYEVMYSAKVSDPIPVAPDHGDSDG